MRAVLAVSLVVSSFAFGCAAQAVDHDDVEADVAESTGALSAYGKGLVGTFQTADKASDYDTIVLRADGTYETSETVTCIKAPCEPRKDSGKFIGYKPKSGSSIGGLRLTSKTGASWYYRVSVGAPNESFDLSRDGKTWFAYDAAVTCNYSAPNKRYVGKSVEECMVIRYACDVGQTFFSDSCGCGCQTGK